MEQDTKKLPFFNSFVAKLNGAALFLAVILALILNTVPVYYAQNIAFRARERTMREQVESIAVTLSWMEKLDTAEIPLLAARFSTLPSERLMLLDEGGRVLYDSVSSDNRQNDRVVSPEVAAALRGRMHFSSRYIHSAFYSQITVPVLHEGQTTGVIFLSYLDTVLGTQLQSVRSAFGLISFFIALLLFGMSIPFSLRYTRQMQTFFDTFSQMEKGNYLVRLNENGRDDFAKVRAELNRLNAALAATEEMRRRFVSDASHELKTPLASVKLLSDSILQTPHMKQEDIREFLTDINNEIDRLTRISGRLLQLSTLEDKTVQPSFLAVNAKLAAENVCRMLLPLAKSHFCTIRLELADDCFVYASYDLLYQIFYNLVENSIKYSGQNKEVRVFLFSRENQVHFIVDDDGEGIPEKDLERIFDRFYRVDRARARSTGGTGLGLSIVATAVQSCGGTVSAANRAAGGARFTVVFPLAVGARDAYDWDSTPADDSFEEGGGLYGE